jgi:hypothetical protein
VQVKVSVGGQAKKTGPVRKHFRRGQLITIDQELDFVLTGMPEATFWTFLQRLCSAGHEPQHCAAGSELAHMSCSIAAAWVSCSQATLCATRAR